VRERIRISDLVVAGTITGTELKDPQTIDGTELDVHLATLHVDRVFKGNFQEKLDFRWFSVHSSNGNMLYAGPPTADFRAGKRYLVFLIKDKHNWRVAMPLYALEMELAPRPPDKAVRDWSQGPLEARYWAIAEELENAALHLPRPDPGTTGMAPVYMSAVYDLIGACADPFFLLFRKSDSPELRKEVARQLATLRNQSCKVP
jgi:hypothetical protein